MEEKDLTDTAFKLVDPGYKNPAQKSRTPFLSFCPFTGQIIISAFLARQMGFMSGDRLGFIGHKNPFVWLIFKTTQTHRTVEIKIKNGIYTANSKKWTSEIGKPFKFSDGYKSKIRLYVNLERPVTSKITLDGVEETATMYQLFDIPALREDFTLAFEHVEYMEMMKTNDYIISPAKK